MHLLYYCFSFFFFFLSCPVSLFPPSFLPWLYLTVLSFPFLPSFSLHLLLVFYFLCLLSILTTPPPFFCFSLHLSLFSFCCAIFQFYFHSIYKGISCWKSFRNAKVSFLFQGFTYVAPSVLEEMARPSVVKARSPRKPYTPNSGGPFSPRLGGMQNPFTFANGADTSSSSSGQVEQMDTSNPMPSGPHIHQHSQNQIQQQQPQQQRQQPQQQSTWNWKH